MTIKQTLKKLNLKKGFTMIELLVYCAGLILIIGSISLLIYNMYNFYRDTTISPRVDRAGIALIDRLTKDVRTGSSINLAESSLNVTTGTLTLNSKSGSTDIVKKYYLENERVLYQENGGATEYLSPSDMNISALRFIQISTPLSQAIRFEVDITYNTKDGLETRSYDGVAILRHSYE